MTRGGIADLRSEIGSAGVAKGVGWVDMVLGGWGDRWDDVVLLVDKSELGIF